MHPRILNLADVELQPRGHAPTGDAATRYDRRRGEVGSRIGARQLGYNLTAVAPGKSACPFHSHRAEEEMFFILEGSGELRYGDTRHPLRAGDVVACPTGGPDTAHQILNTGNTELRYLAVSTMEPIEVCEYPDSGKFGIYEDQPWERGSDAEPFRHLARRSDSRDYWEGE